jgi:anthranilate phosphoribosyltransferase
LLNLEDLFYKIHNSSEEELINIIYKTQGFRAEELKQLIGFLESKFQTIETNFAVFDCCGTGGDLANTFNISTCSAIVAASNNIKICKNGGRSASSTTGSVDVLETLGINFKLSNEQKLILVEKFGLGFFSSAISAELLAPIKNYSKKHKKTSFISIISPFLSPIKLEAQVIGVGKKEWLDTVIDIAKDFVQNSKRKKIFVIQSKIYNSEQILDELSSASESIIVEINKKGIREFYFRPSNFGIKTAKLEELKSGANHQENAEIILKLLKNQTNEAKIDSVSLNAGLLSCLRTEDFVLEQVITGYHCCKNSIINGNAWKNFEKYKAEQGI